MLFNNQIGVVEILQHCTAPSVFHCLPYIVICLDCIIAALVNQEKMVAPRNREQIFSKLLKISNQFIIKKIESFCVSEIGRRQAIYSWQFLFEVIAEALLKSTAVFVIGIHTHNVSAKFPVELQHLVIDLDGCLDLTSTVALTEFFYPVLIICVLQSM